jgi:hypothetical protein
MLPRSPLLAALAALAVALAAPAATAQASQSLTIEIRDLPATAQSNGTLVALPFTVHATVSGAAPCLSQSGQTAYTIALDAKVTNTTGNATRAQVNPKQVTIAGPVLLPAGGGSAERTEGATLLVYPGPYAGAGLNASVTVTASFSGGNGGCTGSTTAPAQDTADVRATFDPVPALYGNDGSGGNAMPAPGAVLLMAALGAAVLVLRRKQD